MDFEDMTLSYPQNILNISIWFNSADIKQQACVLNIWEYIEVYWNISLQWSVGTWRMLQDLLKIKSVI